MTGLIGLMSGIKFFTEKQCKCGSYFYGDSNECDVCWFKDKVVIVENCRIEESIGRCKEYLAGKCSLCLNITSQLNWSGWKRISYVNRS